VIKKALFLKTSTLTQRVIPAGIAGIQTTWTYTRHPWYWNPLPAGILADYIHLTDLMQNHGANLHMPHSRAMGGGLFELRPKGKEGIGRVFYCTQIGQAIVILHSLVKKTNTTVFGVNQIR